MKILVTGIAGFIGFHLGKRLLEQGIDVVGFDNLNSYYDVSLKEARLNVLEQMNEKSKSKFFFIKGSLENFLDLENVFNEYEPSVVVNLAAQAGVRYSLINPSAYIQSNVVGFQNIIDLSKRFKVKNFLYASSSSVYGGNLNIPFKEDHGVAHPVSLYAATKRSNELVAHTYSHLYDLPTTGLRFFTVYGPWGRPDMALFLFTKSILEGKNIDVFNNGKMMRDFTYIDDVIECVLKLLRKPAEVDNNFDKANPDPSKSWAPYRIFNIGNSSPTYLMDYIASIEECLSSKAKINFLPMQMGDVKETFADNIELEKWIDYKPKTIIKDGVSEFINWYLKFYKIKEFE